jgi:hypothetical protein
MRQTTLRPLLNNFATGFIPHSAVRAYYIYWDIVSKVTEKYITLVAFITNMIRARFRASTAALLRTSLFWDVKRGVGLAVGYRRFGTTYRSFRFTCQVGHKGILLALTPVPLPINRQAFYRGAKSLSRPDWKNNWKVAIFRPTRRSLLPRRPGCTDNILTFFFLSGLQNFEFGRCTFFPSWSG